MSGPRALIAGAAGLVGGLCLKLLLEQNYYERVFALLRRPLPVEHPRLEQQVIDFERLESLDPPVVRDVFCALGTTIRAAGSRPAFRRIELEYPLALARRQASAEAKQFLLVSSAGANPHSSNFYLRVKGELEEKLAALPFDALHIFRPSFLIGDRPEKRRGEAAAIVVARAIEFLLAGGRRKYRAIPAATLAAAMVAAARGGASGRHVYHFDDIKALAG